MELEKKWILEVVEGYVDGLFQDVADHFDLEYGDVSPHQVVQLDKIIADFTELLVEYKNQNK